MMYQKPRRWLHALFVGFFAALVLSAAFSAFVPQKAAAAAPVIQVTVTYLDDSGNPLKIDSSNDSTVPTSDTVTHKDSNGDIGHTSADGTVNDGSSDVVYSQTNDL